MKIYKLILILISYMLIAEQSFAMPNNYSIYIHNSTIEVQLIDPLGNITGYDPIRKTKIENIPNTMYQIVLPYENDSQIPIGHRIENKKNSLDSQVMIGKYQLKFYNTSNQQEQYSIDIGIVYYQDKNFIKSYYPNKTIYPNSVWTYEFEITSMPQGNINQKAAGIAQYTTLLLTKVSTPADLIKDLTTAGQLGYIGNAKFVTELTKEINEIEKERLKVDPSHGSGDDGLTPAQKAKKEYTELLKEITEKYNKPESDEFVKQEAYTVLKEDMEYIIGHL